MFNVGDRVISEYYGEGTVIKNEKDGSTYCIKVQFDKFDIENGDTDGIYGFNKEGYFDMDRDRDR